jgi:hypothetical protein
MISNKYLQLNQHCHHDDGKRASGAPVNITYMHEITCTVLGVEISKVSFVIERAQGHSWII